MVLCVCMQTGGTLCLGALCVCMCTNKWYFVCLQTSDNVSVPKRAAAEQRAVPMAETLLTEVNPSHDDLRSGAFVYIHNGTH